MRLKLIACKVLTREISALSAVCPHYIDVTFLRQGFHNDPALLQKTLQAKIDRIDRGEEVLEQVAAIAQAEQIKLASVQALGAVGEFTVGVFHTAEKQYHANSFAGDFEIVSLTGTINTMDGAFYTHLHMSAGNEKGEVFGGHLNRAVISATCEMVITVIDGRVDRFHSEEIGLNLFQF